MKPIRVFVIDDSALIRAVLSEIINRQPDLTVVGVAGDPYQARERMRGLALLGRGGLSVHGNLAHRAQCPGFVGALALGTGDGERLLGARAGIGNATSQQIALAQPGQPLRLLPVQDDSRPLVGRSRPESTAIHSSARRRRERSASSVTW